MLTTRAVPGRAEFWTWKSRVSLDSTLVLGGRLGQPWFWAGAWLQANGCPQLINWVLPRTPKGLGWAPFHPLQQWNRIAFSHILASSGYWEVVWFGFPQT